MKILHMPKGFNPYKKLGMERIPYMPLINDEVKVYAQIAKQCEPYLKISVNGNDSSIINGKHIKSEQEKHYYMFDLGSFAKDDVVKYSIYADDTASSEYIFEVCSREKIENVEFVQDKSGCVHIAGKDANVDFYIGYADGRLKISNMAFDSDTKIIGNNNTYICTDNNSDMKFLISTKSLFINAYNSNDEIIVDKLKFEITKHKDSIKKLHIMYESVCNSVFGLGERYDKVNRKGLSTKNIVHEKFTYQDKYTYFPLPLYHADNGHGLFVDTKNYVDFCTSDDNDLFSIDIEISQGNLIPDTYFLFGDNAEIINSYSELTGFPHLPPKWAFGIWGSANRWNCKEHIDEEIKMIDKFNYPMSVLVIEAWADEATFYIWNETESEPAKNAENKYEYPEGSKWNNLEQMIDDLHKRDIKLVLWQIPVFKSLNKDEYSIQHDIDCDYAAKEGLVVKNKDLQPYHIPDFWFSNSMLPDFTNPKLCDYWFGKRKYLLDMGVSGFKTDGGEFIYEDDMNFYDGSTTVEMKNGYCESYIKAYKDFIGDGRVLFSRAGGIESKKHTIHWAGDQMSTWEEFGNIIKAGLSVGLSGVPFWGFDIAGFAGEMPSAELYLRSTQAAVFSPIMQWHSEPPTGQFGDMASGHNGTNDRSPWNMAVVTGDNDMLNTVLQYSYLRKSLLPYIYSEAQKSANTGLPMFKHPLLDYSNDNNLYNIEDQFMLGDVMVAPILHEGDRRREVYLPDGVWYNIWSKEYIDGGKNVEVDAELHQIPLFLRDGCGLVFELEDKNLGIIISGTKGSYCYIAENGKGYDIHWTKGVISADGIPDVNGVYIIDKLPFL